MFLVRIKQLVIQNFIRNFRLCRIYVTHIQNYNIFSVSYCKF